MVEKKKLTLCFNCKIPKQKLAYQILMYEHNQTGLPFMFILHEALMIYAKSKGYIDKKNELLREINIGQEIEPDKGKEHVMNENDKEESSVGIQIDDYDEVKSLYEADNYSDMIDG